jgi:hypothetical protein
MIKPLEFLDYDPCRSRLAWYLEERVYDMLD